MSLPGHSNFEGMEMYQTLNKIIKINIRCVYAHTIICTRISIYLFLMLYYS